MKSLGSKFFQTRSHNRPVVLALSSLYESVVAPQRSVKISASLTMNNKIKSQNQISGIIKKLKKSGKKIVFTNGCFDILHRGHVEYLKKAKSLADVLVVGLNTDVSVRRLKEKNRPINKQADRAAVLAAMEMVDYVVFFGQDTPLELIKIVKPNILVKGADWHKDKIIGADFVKSVGGKVISVPFVKGYSTSGLIRKLKKNTVYQGVFNHKNTKKD